MVSSARAHSAVGRTRTFHQCQAMVDAQFVHDASADGLQGNGCVCFTRDISEGIPWPLQARFHVLVFWETSCLAYLLLQSIGTPVTGEKREVRGRDNGYRVPVCASGDVHVSFVRPDRHERTREAAGPLEVFWIDAYDQPVETSTSAWRARERTPKGRISSRPIYGACSMEGCSLDYARGLRRVFFHGRADVRTCINDRKRGTHDLSQAV